MDEGVERDPAYVTVSGLFLHRLERLPEVGDSVTAGDWQLDVLTLERRRVGMARLSPSTNHGES